MTTPCTCRNRRQWGHDGACGITVERKRVAYEAYQQEVRRLRRELNELRDAEEARG